MPSGPTCRRRSDKGLLPTILLFSVGIRHHAYKNGGLSIYRVQLWRNFEVAPSFILEGRSHNSVVRILKQRLSLSQLEYKTFVHQKIAGSNLAKGILFFFLFTNLPLGGQNSPKFV